MSQIRITVISLLIVASACKSKMESQIENLDQITDSLMAVEDKKLFPVERDSVAIEKTLLMLDNLYDAELDTRQRQEVFLHELELLNIPGASANPTGVDIADTVGQKYSRCLTSDPAPPSARRNFAFRQLRLASPKFDRLTFKINFHIVYPKARPDECKNLNSRLERQMAILNSEYNSFNVFFERNSTDSLENNDWYDSAYKFKKEYEEMVNSLSANPDKEINVFIVGLDSWLGFATYPWDDQTRFTIHDAILLAPVSINGGPVESMQGKTLVHEIGHFLGLYHIFRDPSKKEDDCCRDLGYNGCNNVNDEVEDTPPQRWCHFTDCRGCDKENECKNVTTSSESSCNTCPNDSHNDLMNNFMGYTPDPCMILFTDGQKKRLTDMIYNHRRQMVKEANLFVL